jgi:TolA-binding protein
MFEKEAEVWWNNKFRPSLYRNAKDVWREGAEFGYNEKHSELENELKWERETKSELADLLGKSNDKIADLEETINKLREQFALRYNLEDKIKDLESQIEKMKCCANCKHSRTEYEHCITDKHEKWEIKE